MTTLNSGWVPLRLFFLLTRTKTSIRYAKRIIERRERERKVKRGAREREVKGIERVKGAQSKPNPLPNAFPKLCEWFSGRFLLRGRGTRTVPFLRGKSSWNLPNREIKRKNYQQKLLQKIWAIISWRRKCGDYRDTGVSKNHKDREVLKYNSQ